MLALRALAFISGALIVLATFGSAVRTMVLPRGVPARLTRFVFLSMRFLFRLRIGRNPSYEKQDRVMALYAPLSLLVLLLVWLALAVGGYMLMFWALGIRSLREALLLSGSSLTTLGFERAPNLAAGVLAFTEAALGLMLLALLITFLPSLYGAFARRETAVAALEVRAGAPPSGVEMIERYWILGRADRLAEVWVRWEAWFVEVEESHTSFPALVFFRSSQPDHSWVTAAGAVLDAASLMASTVDLPRDVQAEFCIRAGYLALRRIADFFRIPYDPDPIPTDPITVTREEFDLVSDQLAAQGVPLRGDRDQAWRDFAGWRVNYDTVLVALSNLVMAPYAPWSSDRSLTTLAPALTRSRSTRNLG